MGDPYSLATSTLSFNKCGSVGKLALFRGTLDKHLAWALSVAWDNITGLQVAACITPAFSNSSLGEETLAMRYLLS